MSVVKKCREVYAWNDYRQWPDDKRWEIIDGQVFAMSPAPQTRHQLVLMNLASALLQYFRNRSCSVFPAPTDLKLSDTDIVQPDIMVVCDKDQINKTHIEGAPSLVVEIQSPSTLAHDRIRKTHLYSKYGVKEYWLVNPYPALVEVLSLDGEKYRIHQAYGGEDILQSPSFDELEIDLENVFVYPVSDDERVDEVRESPAPYASRSAIEAG